MSSNEQVFLQENNVLVSSTRLILDGDTYAMSNITSVSKRIRPVSKKGAIILMAIGAFLAFVMLVGESMGGFAFSVLIIAGGVFWFRSIKPDFVVSIASGSGETDGMTSDNEDFIDRIVMAINEAIIARG